MSKQNKAKRINILDIRKITTKNGDKAVVQFSKGVEVFFNGKPVDLGQYGTLFIKTKAELEQDINFLLEKDYITEEEAQQKRDRLEDKKITGSIQAVVE